MYICTVAAGMQRTVLPWFPSRRTAPPAAARPEGPPYSRKTDQHHAVIS